MNDDGSWKSVSDPTSSDSNVKTVVRKRQGTKLRETPHYFMPKRSLPYTVLHYGAYIAAGVGIATVLEIWMNKRVKEDSDVIWRFDK